MSTPDKDIRYSVTAEDRFSSTFTRLRSDLSGSRDQLAGIASMASVATRALGAISLGALAGGGMAAGIARLIDDLDAFNDAADATGASVEKLSALDGVARRNGESLDTVVAAALKLNKVLTEATQGSAMAATLQRLGLDAAELRRVDPAEAVQRVAQALGSYADDGNKARLTQELFGKSTKELAAFLKDVAGAGDLAAKTTSAQAEQAERLNKEFYNLKAGATDLARSLTAELVPAINRMFNGIREMSSGPGLGAALGEVFKGTTISSAAQGLSHYNGELAKLDRQIADIRAGKSAAVSIYGTDWLGELETKRKKMAQFADTYRNMLNAGTEGAGRGSISFEGPKKSVGSPTPEPKKGGQTRQVTEADRYLESLRRQAEQLQNLSVSEQLLADITHKRIDGLTPAMERQLKLAAAQVDEQKRLAETPGGAQALASYVQGLERQISATRDLTERQKALDVLRSVGATGQLNQTEQLVLSLADEVDLRERSAGFAKAMTAELERQASVQKSLDDAIDGFTGRTSDALKQVQTARLEQRIASGEIFSAEELDRAVKGIGGIVEALDAAKDKVGEIDKRWEQFTGNMQDAFAQTIEGGLRGDMDSIEKMWANMLLRMVSQAAAAKLTQALFGSTDEKSGASTSGILGDLFRGWMSGAAGRATGGPVSAGSLYRINETGRIPGEIFSAGGAQYLLPTESGRVIPAGAGAQASGVVQTNHFVIQGGDPAQTKAQIMAAIQANNTQLARATRYSMG